MVEVIEQVLPLLIWDLRLPFDRVEINVVFENSRYCVVVILYGGDGLVEHVSDVLLEILKWGDLVPVLIGPRFVPAGTDWYEENIP